MRVGVSAHDEGQGSDATKVVVSVHDERRAQVSSGCDETPELGSGCVEAGRR